MFTWDARRSMQKASKPAEYITLKNRRRISDLVFITYKALSGMIDCDASDFGLHLKNSYTIEDKALGFIS